MEGKRKRKRQMQMSEYVSIALYVLRIYSRLTVRYVF